MYNLLIPIAEITPNTRTWTAKVLVKEKLSPRQSQASPKKYQRFIFVDKDGTEVQAICYSPDLNTMSEILELQETYHITNVRVTIADAKYKLIASNKFQWIISKHTVVRKIINEALPRELGAPMFVEFTDIPTYIGKDTRIAIIGIVIDHLETKTIATKYGSATVQDFFIVDENAQPILLSLWNEVLFTNGSMITDATDKMSIIACTRIQVTNYNGISLSARGPSGVIVNPSYPAAQHLRTWRTKNHAVLSKLVEEKNYLKKHVSEANKENQEYLTLASIIMSNSESTNWTRANVKLQAGDQQFWYMACDNCLKGTAGHYKMNIRCNYCLTEAMAIPRMKFSLILADETSQLEVVIFGELAEQVLGKSALEIMNYEKEVGEKIDCNSIIEKLKCNKLGLEIKKKIHQSHYGADFQYIVVAINEELNDSSLTSETKPDSNFVPTVVTGTGQSTLHDPFATNEVITTYTGTEIEEGNFSNQQAENVDASACSQLDH